VRVEPPSTGDRQQDAGDGQPRTIAESEQKAKKEPVACCTLSTKQYIRAEFSVLSKGHG